MAASSTQRLVDHRVSIKQGAPSQRAKELARKRAQSKLRRELKGYDCIVYGRIRQVYNTNIDTIQVVNLTNTGSGSYNRVGRKIFLRSARMRFEIIFNFWNNLIYELGVQRGLGVRIALVYDRQPSGTLPSFGDIFSDQTNEGGLENTINSSLNFSNTSRFHVLRDFMVVVDPPFLANVSTASVQPPIVLSRFVDEYVDLQELETIYSRDSTECTIADISSGALYFVRVASVDASDIAEADIQGGSIRLRYTD